MKIERDLDYKIKVMTACKEGKKIRFKCNDSDIWEESCNELEFNWAELDYEIIPENPEFNYPMWFSCNFVEGLLVQFESLNKGIVINKGKSVAWAKGDCSNGFRPHTDSTIWTQIEEPKQKVTIEKWLLKTKGKELYWEYATNEIDKYILCNLGVEKVRLIESYDIEI